MNINSIHGGQTEDFRPGLPAPNVPDSCRTVIDRRFLLEESIDDVKAEVTSILDRLKSERPKFDYSINDLFEVQPNMTDRDAPVVTAVAEGISGDLGKEPDYVISPGTYDQKHVARIGHLFDCIAYGPGILDLAHRPDEWVGIDDMVESAKVMAIGPRRAAAWRGAGIMPSGRISFPLGSKYENGCSVHALQRNKADLLPGRFAL
jgi:succinyl-diaminopimelate desuccinylase